VIDIPFILFGLAIGITAGVIINWLKTKNKQQERDQ
jgi:hypothetical protein